MMETTIYRTYLVCYTSQKGGRGANTPARGFSSLVAESEKEVADGNEEIRLDVENLAEGMAKHQGIIRKAKVRGVKAMSQILSRKFNEYPE